MRRYEVSDELWEGIKDLFPTRGGRTDNRLFFNAVHVVAKSGIPWRDLPPRYGKWNSVYTRFNRLSKSGLWQKIFDRVADGDFRQLLIDSSAVRVNHQGANGLKKTKRRQPWADPVAD